MIRAYTFHDVPIPESLIPPELHDVEIYIWRDYQELSTERNGGMGKMAIPWSSIRAYHQHKPTMDWQDFHRLIRAMDHVFLTHESKPEK